MEANGKGDDHPELRWYEHAGVELHEGYRTQERSQDRTYQVDNESPIVRRSSQVAGHRPDRVLQMSMATSQ